MGGGGGQKTMHTPSHTESAIMTEALQFNYPKFKTCVSGHPMFCLNTFTIIFGHSYVHDKHALLLFRRSCKSLC